MICPYGFIRFNTILFGAVRSTFGANTTGTQFSDNYPRGSYTGNGEFFESGPFFGYFLMICSYGFIKFNTLLFGAVRSPFGANTTETQFSDNSPRGSYTGNGEFFESARFLDIF